MDNQWRGKGVVADLTFKPGKTTITKIEAGFNNMFIMTGDIMCDKRGFVGPPGGLRWTPLSRQFF
ncbi:MAG: hypothetical protein ACM3YE_14720 [Bacteroidota bacterium]